MLSFRSTISYVYMSNTYQKHRYAWYFVFAFLYFSACVRRAAPVPLAPSTSGFETFVRHPSEQ